MIQLKTSEKAISVIFGLITALFIICTSVVLTLNFKPLYYFDIGYLGIPETTGMSKEVIRNNYDALIDYNNITGSEKLEIPDFPMSEGGIIHFEEVKHIFTLVEWIALISLILLIPVLILTYRKRRILWLKYAADITISLPVFIGALIALNWERFFVLFHKIAFNNDFWLFDPATDPVITILPDTFFMHCAILMIACIVIGGIICALVYRKLKGGETPDTISPHK